MLRIAHYTLAAASITLALVGCQDATAPDDAPKALNARPTLSTTAGALVPRIIEPHDTDPAIDRWLEAHYVWLDPAARSNGTLFVLLGGANSAPSDMQLVAQEAARSGYHVIVLMYPNSKGVQFCGKLPNPEECQENMRLEILNGTDLSDSIDVSVANSIDNRLTKVLRLLAHSAPEEGWSRFLRAGTPKWRRIAIAGFSLGGGQAALIAKLRRVDRVVLLAAPLDGFGGRPGAWVTTAATPAERYFGLVHRRDPNVTAALANWSALGLDTFGVPVLQDTSKPPYGGTHTLLTDLPPQASQCKAPGTHRGVAEDLCTPLDSDGAPALRDAWSYLMTASPWRTRSDSDDDSDESDLTPLVQHIIAPYATDPRINRALANHYVWLDPTARSNHKLFLFLPSGRSAPDTFQLIGQEAARLGYHVISLMYQNDLILVALCGAAAARSAAAGNACYQSARLDIIDGGDRSLSIPELVQAGFDISGPNSIDTRLTKLLEYLDAWHPEEGWSRFLANGAPKWSRIAVGGHSQGGGEAAMIAKIRLVPRVVMFSSVPDTVPSREAPTWLSSHMTPSNRYFALAHDCDGFFRSIVAGWDSLGMNALVAASPLTPTPPRPNAACWTWTSPARDAPVAPEASAPPYRGTHTLITDLPPRTGGFVHRPSHQSTANDFFTPRDPVSGAPLLRDAWRYLLGAQEADEEVADEQDERDEADVGRGSGGTRW